MDLIAHTIHNYSDQIWMFPKLLDSEYADNVLNMLEHCEYNESKKLDPGSLNYVFAQCKHVSHELVDYINSDNFHAFVNHHTSQNISTTLSCWASAYSLGHYLTPHSDAVGKRKMAYIFYFNKGWKAEWGGNIAFDKGTHWQMFVPQNGTLALFNVEDNNNKHMVTNVAVDNTRYAITGWLI
jgi:Rps23 Pro-64 3,4-dihydroxylase Tpa1-like proline 4-hydroxylase